MELQQQQHSYVQKVGKEFVSSSVQSHNTSGTRMVEAVYKSTFQPAGTGSAFMLPIFNCLFVDQGNGANQRSGNTIFIHRFEVSFTLKENAGNNIGPDEAGVVGQSGTLTISDPRYRIMLVTPKNQYRFAPTAGSTVSNATFPYFSSAQSATYPEPVSLPVQNLQQLDYGMQLLPDPMYYNVEYDDIRNIKYNTSNGCDSGSFSFLIRKSFNYDQVDYLANARVRFNDNTLQEMIPQIWFNIPAQWKDETNITASTGRYDIFFSMRMIYDNVNG